MRPAVSSRTRAPATGSSRRGKSTAGLAAIENIAGPLSKPTSSGIPRTVFPTVLMQGLPPTYETKDQHG
jgi:hypothetical protein